MGRGPGSGSKRLKHQVCGLYTPAIANTQGNHTKMGLEQLLVLIERSPMMHGKILIFSIRKLRKVVFH